jgi:hypothetical protein
MSMDSFVAAGHPKMAGRRPATANRGSIFATFVTFVSFVLMRGR